MPEIALPTVLPAPIGEVWERVQHSATLVEVSRGLLGFRPLDPAHLPERWAPGRYRVALRLFGVIPAGEQVIGIEFPETAEGVRSVRDNGGGTLFPVWDHTILLEPAGPDATHYTDHVRYRSRLPDPLAALFVRVFYRYRQWRWRRLLKS